MYVGAHGYVCRCTCGILEGKLPYFWVIHKCRYGSGQPNLFEARSAAHLQQAEIDTKRSSGEGAWPLPKIQFAACSRLRLTQEKQRGRGVAYAQDKGPGVT